MNCQDALRHALAGGPLPADAQEHVRCCLGCTRELRELRSIESRLAGAAPLPEGTERLERRILERLRHRRRLSWTHIPAAAGLLMAAALMTAWLTRVPAPRTAAPLPPTTAASADLSYLDDSTADLLRAFEPMAEQLPDVSAEEMEGVLSPTDQGGWNG